ncbi:WD40 repeat domain-containing protein, partial [Actinomadura adrarensis]
LATGKEVDGDHNAPNQHPFAGARQFTGTTFSPDGRFLAVRVGDEIAVVDVPTREIHTTLAVPNGLRTEDLSFSRDGNYLATDMTMWSTEPGFRQTPYLRYKPDTACYGTSFNRDGTSLRCADGEDRIRSIDVSGFTRRLRFSQSPAYSTISQDGATLAVRVSDSEAAPSIQIWDTASRKR